MTIKAEKEVINIGTIALEGLLLEDGRFGVYKAQAMYVVNPTIAPTATSREFIRILATKHGQKLAPKGFEIIQADVIGLRSKSVDVISLPDFTRFLRICDKLEYQHATDLIDALVDVTLHQLFCRAFKKKFDDDDVQEHLRSRMESKDFYFELSGEVESWFERTKASRTQPIERYFSNTFDAINLGLFKKKSKKIREELGLKLTNSLIRDYFNKDALRRITQIQSIAANQMRHDKDLRPVDAVKLALKSSLFEIIDYSKDK